MKTYQITLNQEEFKTIFAALNFHLCLMEEAVSTLEKNRHTVDSLLRERLTRATQLYNNLNALYVEQSANQPKQLPPGEDK